MEEVTVFRTRLQAIVKEKGWNQKTLAARSGIHYQKINKLLRGERADPRGSTLIRLADCLGVSTDYLLGRVQEEVKA